MIIRKATVADVNAIAIYVFDAMGEILYQFIGLKDRSRALKFLKELIAQDNNQYSYQNCWVVEDDNLVLAAALVYDGAELEKLKEPVRNKIFDEFGIDFNPEDETQKGEYYIDCIGVADNQQGKGIGTILLNFLIAEFVHKRNLNLGLLVDVDNPLAKKLYLKLGFQSFGVQLLVGKKMEHLQYLSS